MSIGLNSTMAAFASGQHLLVTGGAGLSKRQEAWDSSQVCPCERGSPLADLLKRHFETLKLLRAQFREHSPHLAGMPSKG
jgi:hypothetical protein